MFRTTIQVIVLKMPFRVSFLCPTASSSSEGFPGRLGWRNRVDGVETVVIEKKVFRGLGHAMHVLSAA